MTPPDPVEAAYLSLLASLFVVIRVLLLVEVLLAGVAVVYQAGSTAVAAALAAPPQVTVVGPVFVTWNGWRPRPGLAWNGRSLTLSEPPTGARAAARWVAIELAGPAANVVVGGLCLLSGWDTHVAAVGLAHGHLARQALLLFAAINLVVAGVDLVPLRRRGRASAGYVLWIALRAAFDRRSVLEAVRRLAASTTVNQLPLRRPPRLDRPEPAFVRIQHVYQLVRVRDFSGAVEAARAPCRAGTAAQRRALDSLFVAAALRVGDPALHAELDQVTERLLRQGPGDAGQQVWLRAAVLDRLHRPQEAVALLAPLVDGAATEATSMRAAHIDNTFVMAVLQSGDVTRYRQAETAIARALRFAPREPAYLHTRGWLLIETGHPGEGLVLVDEADALVKDRSPAVAAEILATRALGEAMLGRHDAARHLVTQAEAHDPLCGLLPRIRRALDST